VLTQDGQRVAPIMGSYGIGVERALATIVETHHDDRGIVWPLAVAPFHVVIVQLGADEATASAALELYERLGRDGIEVILDDRAERPGVKFSDAELVGIPLRVTIGARGLSRGVVEVTMRATGDTVEVPVAEAAAHLAALAHAL
jgi:prolyl-tRNA synthetase